MTAVTGSELDRVRHLFDAEHLALVVKAMAAGNTPGRAWTDGSDSPDTALVWDGGRNVFLTGAADVPRTWRELFDREIAATDPGFLKIQADGTAAAVFDGYGLECRERVLYRRSPGSPLSDRRPAGFRISAIRADLKELEHFGDVVEEIESCWDSMQSFLRRGFGFVAHDAERIVCWCTAECVSDGQCGVGIETVPQYQGRGLATATASAFAAHCDERSLTAYWDAWMSNRPSRATAENVGFIEAERYSILAGSIP